MVTTTPKQEISAINQLAPVERAYLALSASHNESALVELSGKYVDVTEIKDQADYDMVMRGGIELMKARTTIQATGKAAREDATAYRNAVLAEEKRLIAITKPEENRLKDLRSNYDIEQARIATEAFHLEKRRIADITERIQGIRGQAEGLLGSDATAIQLRLDAVNTILCNETLFEEFADTAMEVKAAAVSSLEAALAERVALEEQQAEQRRVAEEQAARQAELDRQAEEQLEREAAAQEKIDAEKTEVRRQQGLLDAAKRDEEEKEKIRVSEIKSRIQGIRDMVHLDPGVDPGVVRSRVSKVIDIDLSTFAEFSEEAEDARVKTIQTLEEIWHLKTDAAKAAKVKAEKNRLEREAKEREEAEQLKAEQEAEAERQEALRPEKDKLVEWAESLSGMTGPDISDPQLKELMTVAERDISIAGSILMKGIEAL